MITVSRRFVHAPRAGQLGRAHAHAVDLDVVGVAVVAVLVVDGEHVGSFVDEKARETRRGLVEVGAPERIGVVVGGFSRHTRIAVAEKLDAVDAEHCSCGVQLGDPAVDERLAFRQHIWREFAELAARGRNEDHAVAVALGARHRTTRRDRFVVGVCMKEDDRVRHRFLITRAGRAERELRAR